MDYLRIEQMADTANQFMFRLQSAVDTPILHFKETAGKIAYGVATLLRIAYLAGVLACLGLLADSIAETFFGIRIAWWPAVKELVATSPWVQLGLIVLALVVIRRLLIRMIAPEPRGDSRTL
jgi:hypothetical protein